MYRDIKTGVYNASRDPPFIHSHSRAYTNLQKADVEEEEIPPLEQPRPKPVPEYKHLMTPWQRREYEYWVADMLDMQFSRMKRGMARSRGRATNEKEELQFAIYQVDYHIHLHDRARCDMLTLCRDIEDMRQLRGWKAEMARVDWDDQRDDEVFNVHLTNLWRRRSRFRRQRLIEVRKRWSRILEERRKQRQKLLWDMEKERQREQVAAQERVKAEAQALARVKIFGSREGDRVLLGEFNV